MSRLADRLLDGYVRLTAAAAPVGRLILAIRRRRGKEDAERWGERLGIADRPPTSGQPTVWLHAASVGETVAVLPLVERIVATGVRVVLTSVTTTSAAIAGSRLPPGAVHQFVPLDFAPFLDRFLATWAPQLAVFVESEIWPVAVQRLSAARIPIVVANARMSDRSFRGWSRVHPLAAAIFGRLTVCLAQSEADAGRFRALGVPRVVTIGNIKYDAAVPEADAAEAEALAQAIAGRPVFLAASTHPGEEAIVADAFDAVRARVPDLLLVVAPRHPDRGAAVEAELAGRGLVVVRRSTGALPYPGKDAYVADTVGELGTFYRLADVAFVGGSLTDNGGHNPIEPARLGAPVITGPFVSSFRDPYRALGEAGGSAVVANAAELADAAARLLEDADLRAARTAAAAAVVERTTGALDRTFRALEPMIAAIMVSDRLARREARR